MYKRILIPLDGSQLAETALTQARNLAQGGSEIVLLQIIRQPLAVVTPDVGMTVPVVDMGEMVDETMSYLNAFVEPFRAEGLHISADVMEDDDVSHAIAEYARSHDIDLIVQSTHGRSGLTRLLFGSVAEGVISQAPCPVMLVYVGHRA